MNPDSLIPVSVALILVLAAAILWPPSPKPIEPIWFDEVPSKLPKPFGESELLAIASTTPTNNE